MKFIAVSTYKKKERIQVNDLEITKSKQEEGNIQWSRE